MRWGFSKSLGGGFRIGTGGRLGGSRKRSGPTQRELQQQEKEQFLESTKSNFEALLTQWFICQGHLVLPADAMRAESDVGNKSRALVESFNGAQRMVRDGGPLTAKRRETMLECVYAIEKMVEEIQQVHPLAEAYDHYLKLRSSARFLVGAGFLFLFFGLWFIFFTVLGLISIGAGIYLFRVSSKFKVEVKASASVVVSEL